MSEDRSDPKAEVSGSDCARLSAIARHMAQEQKWHAALMASHPRTSSSSSSSSSEWVKLDGTLFDGSELSPAARNSFRIYADMRRAYLYMKSTLQRPPNAPRYRREWIPAMFDMLISKFEQNLLEIEDAALKDDIDWSADLKEISNILTEDAGGGPVDDASRKRARVVLSVLFFMDLYRFFISFRQATWWYFMPETDITGIPFCSPSYEEDRNEVEALETLNAYRVGLMMTHNAAALVRGEQGARFQLEHFPHNLISSFPSISSCADLIDSMALRLVRNKNNVNGLADAWISDSQHQDETSSSSSSSSSSSHAFGYMRQLGVLLQEEEEGTPKHPQNGFTRAELNQVRYLIDGRLPRLEEDTERDLQAGVTPAEYFNRLHLRETIVYGSNRCDTYSWHNNKKLSSAWVRLRRVEVLFRLTRDKEHLVATQCISHKATLTATKTRMDTLIRSIEDGIGSSLFRTIKDRYASQQGYYDGMPLNSHRCEKCLYEQFHDRRGVPGRSRSIVVPIIGGASMWCINEVCANHQHANELRHLTELSSRGALSIPPDMFALVLEYTKPTAELWVNDIASPEANGDYNGVPPSQLLEAMRNIYSQTIHSIGLKTKNME